MLGVPQHILRYWETRFPQLKPLQRAGNRRYYRPPDVALAQRIDRLLNHEGYTVRGVQKLLEQGEPAAAADVAPVAPSSGGHSISHADLVAIRALLAEALNADA